MDVVIGIGHPAHVHFYRNAIAELEGDGYAVDVFTKPREMAIKLLDSYGVPYSVLGSSKIQHTNRVKTAISFLKYELDVLEHIRTRSPSVVTGVGNIPLAHASSLFDTTSMIFSDSERSPIANRLCFPFADKIFTPDSFSRKLGPNQVRYPGYHELAYLHPNRFSPDPGVIAEAGIDPEERYFVLRFVAWEAVHDIGQRGLSLSDKRDLVSELSEYGNVYISSESKLPDEFEQYQIPVNPDAIHHLLNFADLYIGDSQTMATEAAVLGTPSIRSNSFAGDTDMGNFVELERNYGLLYSTSDGADAKNTAISWLREGGRGEWEMKRDNMLKDKIDVTQYMVDRIEDSI